MSKKPLEEEHQDDAISTDNMTPPAPSRQVDYTNVHVPGNWHQIHEVTMIGVDLADQALDPDSAYDLTDKETLHWTRELQRDLQSLDLYDRNQVINFIREHFEGSVACFYDEELVLCADTFANRILRSRSTPWFKAKIGVNSEPAQS